MAADRLPRRGAAAEEARAPAPRPRALSTLRSGRGGLRGREAGGAAARGRAAAVGRPPARTASSSLPPTAGGAPGRASQAAFSEFGAALWGRGGGRGSLEKTESLDLGGSPVLLHRCLSALPPPLQIFLIPFSALTRALNDSFLNEGCGGGKQWKERPRARTWRNDDLGHHNSPLEGLR